jgi:hypothetical protein
VIESYQPKAEHFTIGHNFQQWTNHEVDGIKVTDKEPLRVQLNKHIKQFLTSGKKIETIPLKHQEIPVKGRVVTPEAAHSGWFGG